jgi:hypothetical protein
MYSSKFVFKQVVSGNFSAFFFFFSFEQANEQSSNRRKTYTPCNMPRTANPGLEGYPAACSSEPAGAAYGAVHRASKSYFCFLSEPVPACKRLWGREMTPKTIGHTNRISDLFIFVNPRSPILGQCP